MTEPTVPNASAFDSEPATPIDVAGDVIIKPQVVFSLALDATLRTYGVLGIASRYTGYDTTRRDPSRGLDVEIVDHEDGTRHVTVTVSVIAEYGVRLPSVIASLQHQIGYAIEHATGYSVDTVHVHVAAVRVTQAP